MGGRAWGTDLHGLTHIDLFAGIGGFALAAKWAGFRTVAFCEIEPFCQEVLKARFGAVADTGNAQTPRQRGNGGEILSITESMGFDRSYPLLIPDIHAFDGTQFRGATLLTGGVPCQPASVAGKRKGTADDRWLWPEAIRILAEVKPTWTIFENPCGILSLEHGLVFENLLSQMEGEGYEVRSVIIPACAVNAPHRRDRVWIVAHDPECSGRPGSSERTQAEPHSNGAKDGLSQSPDSDAQDALLGRNGRWGDGDTPRLRRALQTAGSNSDAPDAEGAELDRSWRTRTGRKRPADNGWDIPWIEVATRLCRVDAGVPNRVDRLKALGNAIVPQVAYRIIKAIAEIKEDYLT